MDYAMFAFLEEMMTPVVKPAAVKWARSKHPTGRGEQALNKSPYASARAMAEKEEVRYVNAPRYAAKGPSSNLDEWDLEEGDSFETVAYAGCAEEYSMLETASQEEVEDNSEDWETEEKAFWVEMMSKDVIIYEAPQPMDTSVRAWYPKNGAAARLTQRRYSADCGAPVPGLTYNPDEL